MDVPESRGMSGPGRRRLIAAFALQAILSACTVGPDFVKPKAEIPSQWSAPALKSAAKPMSKVSATALATDAWWTGFHDPILSSLIARAAKANLDLKESALRIAEARAQREITAAGQWPTLGGNASYTNQRISETTATGSIFGSLSKLGGGHGPVQAPSFPNPYDQFQTGFDASWEPDLFGGIHRSVEAAGADTEASQEDAHDALVSLEGEVARDYIDLRSAQAHLAITKRNIATDQQVLSLARDRRKAGLGTDLDVVNAAAQVTQSQSLIPGFDSEIAQDVNGLSRLLAEEPNALAGELDAPRPVPSVPAEIRIGMPGDLLRRRADIRAAEARLHAATARVGVATANLFPSLTFDASFGTQAERFPDLANWASRFFAVGPNVNVPIFEGGRLKATVTLADVQEKEAAVDYARSVLNAVHDVENALQAYRAEQDRRASLAATLAQNRDALALAQDRYRSGLTTFLDVLDAERTAQTTELSLADSTAAVSTDLVALYKALGGGWNTDPEHAAPAG